MSRRPPHRHRPPGDRVAATLRDLRAEYESIRPAPDLAARIRTTLRRDRRAAERRTARRLVASLLLGVVGGWLLGRAPGLPTTPSTLSVGPLPPLGPPPSPPHDPATTRLRRLVATADALPCPSPALLEAWRAALRDDDADVRATAATLLRAAHAPVPCADDAP